MMIVGLVVNTAQEPVGPPKGLIRLPRFTPCVRELFLHGTLPVRFRLATAFVS